MIQCQLKLQLRPAQERMLVRWLWRLTGVYNWTLRKLELDARDGILYSRYDLHALIAGHGSQIGIAAHTLRATANTAHDAWLRHRRGISNRPRLKGRRNRLNSLLFVDRLQVSPTRRILLSGFGRVKFHAQAIPDGPIKCGRVVRRPSGWYLCLVIEAEPNAIPHLGNCEVGIDPGFHSLLTLSSGEKIAHPLELQRTSVRLAQAQRGGRRRLASRLHEHARNQRKDRNHKLSRRLVSEYALIVWSKDNHRAVAMVFGKSVASAAHGDFKQKLSYKCRSGGREFIEVSNRYSTRICSACGAKTGPRGLADLSVRQWVCGCGAEHDRDVNAAVNTLIAGRGVRLERTGDGSSGIAA